jgi:hypothetical protein
VECLFPSAPTLDAGLPGEERDENMTLWRTI